MSAYEDIAGRLRFHIDLTRKKSVTYYVLARALVWGIPILSGILTALASGQLWSGSEALTVWLGALVTILTLVNSTVRPQETFTLAVRYANMFVTFHTALGLEMEKIQAEIGREAERAKAINELLTKKNQALNQLIDEFNQGLSALKPPSGKMS